MKKMCICVFALVAMCVAMSIPFITSTTAAEANGYHIVCPNCGHTYSFQPSSIGGIPLCPYCSEMKNSAGLIVGGPWKDSFSILSGCVTGDVSVNFAENNKGNLSARYAYKFLGKLLNDICETELTWIPSDGGYLITFSNGTMRKATLDGDTITLTINTKDNIEINYPFGIDITLKLKK